MGFIQLKCKLHESVTRTVCVHFFLTIRLVINLRKKSCDKLCTQLNVKNENQSPTELRKLTKTALWNQQK